MSWSTSVPSKQADRSMIAPSAMLKSLRRTPPRRIDDSLQQHYLKGSAVALPARWHAVLHHHLQHVHHLVPLPAVSARLRYIKRAEGGGKRGPA